MSKQLTPINTKSQYSPKIQATGASLFTPKETSDLKLLGYGNKLQKRLIVKANGIEERLSIVNSFNRKTLKLKSHPRSVLKPVMTSQASTSILKKKNFFTLKHKPTILKRISAPEYKLLTEGKLIKVYNGKNATNIIGDKILVINEHNYFRTVENSPRRNTIDVATELHNRDEVDKDVLIRNRSISLPGQEAELLNLPCATIEVKSEVIEEEFQDEFMCKFEEDQDNNEIPTHSNLQLNSAVPKELVNFSTQTEVEKKHVGVNTEQSFDSLVKALVDQKLEEKLKDVDLVDYIVGHDGMLEAANSSNWNCDLNQSNRQVAKELNLQTNSVPNVEPWKLRLFLDLKNCSKFDPSGNMPLHVAVIQNDIKCVKRQCLALQACKIGVNCINKDNLTALQLALLYNSDISIVQILLQHQANTNVLDLEGNTILHNAVMYSSDTVVALLVSSMLQNIDAVNYEGYTPLMLCVMNKKYKMADTLLEKGDSNPNIGDKKSGRTALFHAVENNDLEMVKLLLYHKAETKVKNFFGTSAHDAMYEMDSIDAGIRKVILNRDDVTSSRPKSSILRAKRKKPEEKKTVNVKNKKPEVKK